MTEFIQQFLEGIRQTGWVEWIAVIAGIMSVYYSRLENILVYPVGLINTLFYIYLSFKGHLFGEATVNLYYTIMSIYGWILWSKKNARHEHVVHIEFSSRKMLGIQIAFFAACYAVIYLSLTYLKNNFAPGAIPWADGLASAAAFTGMWLMAKKKVESWYWWMITNIASMPLYFVKGYALSSVFYFILLIMAVAGLMAWRKKALAHQPPKVQSVPPGT